MVSCRFPGACSLRRLFSVGHLFQPGSSILTVRSGDVLGAGRGWAMSVLLHKQLRQQFVDFFARKNTFTLGVCNGCQFLTRLKSLIPGAESWPSFERNTSEQYEARFCMVEILDPKPQSASVFLHDMSGTKMPIALSHGEGRAYFAGDQQAGARALMSENLVAVRYVDNLGRPTEQYPANPNGSPLGIAGLRSADGRQVPSIKFILVFRTDDCNLQSPRHDAAPGEVCFKSRVVDSTQSRLGTLRALGPHLQECSQVDWVSV